MNNYHKDASVVGTKSSHARRSIIKAVITLSLLVPVLLFFAPPIAASDIFVAQSASGSADGSSCANAYAISFFNTSGNWGSTSGKIGPGTTVHLCGTITTALTVQGNGSSGTPITVKWESGASVPVCSTAGAVQLANRSYIELDLGGNATAIACPNNGTALATQISAVGITSNGNGWNHIEIHNGSLGPMYVYSGTANNGFGSICIDGGNGANNTHVHHLTLKGCAEGIEIDPTTNTTDEFDHLTVDASVGRVLNYANGSASSIASTNSTFHDNDIDYTTVWAVPSGYQHYETLHLYNTGNSGSQDSIRNFQIYNNTFHGMSPTNSGSTALIFAGEGGSSCNASSYNEVKIFNNLIIDTGDARSGFSSGSGGYFYMQDCEQRMSVYNNTVDAGASSNTCFRFVNTAGGATGNSLNFVNNICIGGLQAYSYDTLFTLSASNNILYDMQDIGLVGSTSYTLARWRTLTGQDGNSLATNPNLNSSYIPNSGSPAILAGANLTSLNITALNSDKAGVARPATGAWGIGAYQFAAAAPPNPPTSL